MADSNDNDNARDKVATAISEEIGEWAGLVGRLDGQIEDACEELREWSDKVSTLESGYREFAVEILPALEKECEGAIASLEETLLEKLGEFRETVEEWRDAVDEMKGCVEKEAASMKELIDEAFQEDVENVKRLLEQGCVEHVRAKLATQLMNVDLTIGNTRDEIIKRFDGFVEGTREKLENVVGCLDDSNRQWQRVVGGTAEAFSKLMTDIEEVQKQAETLTEFMSNALVSTGGSMNAATSVLGEIKGILDDIA